MWYEILPSFFCYAGCISLMFVVPPTVNYFLWGKPSTRWPPLLIDLENIRRDNKLDPTGQQDCNNTVYWEGIPDA